MNKCVICGSVATHTVTPYTIGVDDIITADVALELCESHALYTMYDDTAKVYKLENKGFVYPPLVIKLDGHSGGYIE